MCFVQERFDGALEADDVGVVAFQFFAEEAFRKFDDVDGSDQASVFVQVIQVGNDLFLVGDGDIQTVQFRVLF